MYTNTVVIGGAMLIVFLIAALANPKGGFYAEYVAVKADNVSHIPDKLTTEQAGVMGSDALMALRGLDDMLGLSRARR